jgi:hypothetical protein
LIVAEVFSGHSNTQVNFWKNNAITAICFWSEL